MGSLYELMVSLGDVTLGSERLAKEIANYHNANGCFSEHNEAVYLRSQYTLNTYYGFASADAVITLIVANGSNGSSANGNSGHFTVTIWGIYYDMLGFHVNGQFKLPDFARYKYKIATYVGADVKKFADMDFHDAVRVCELAGYERIDGEMTFNLFLPTSIIYD